MSEIKNIHEKLKKLGYKHDVSKLRDDLNNPDKARKLHNILVTKTDYNKNVNEFIREGLNSAYNSNTPQSKKEANKVSNTNNQNFTTKSLENKNTNKPLEILDIERPTRSNPYNSSSRYKTDLNPLSLEGQQEIAKRKNDMVTTDSTGATNNVNSKSNRYGLTSEDVVNPLSVKTRNKIESVKHKDKIAEHDYLTSKLGNKDFTKPGNKDLATKLVNNEFSETIEASHERTRREYEKAMSLSEEEKQKIREGVDKSLYEESIWETVWKSTKHTFGAFFGGGLEQEKEDKLAKEKEELRNIYREEGFEPTEDLLEREALLLKYNKAEQGALENKKRLYFRDLSTADSEKDVVEDYIISEKNKMDALSAEAKTKVDSIRVNVESYKKEIDKIKAEYNNVNTPIHRKNELKSLHGQYLQKILSLGKEYDEYSDIYNRNHTKSKGLKEELTDLKRDYSVAGSIWNSTVNAFGEGVAGLFDFHAMLSELGGNNLDALSSRLYGKGVRKFVHDDDDEYAKPLTFSEIADYKDLGLYVGQSVGEQTWSLAMASTGYGGVAVMGMSSAGSKYSEITEEEEQGAEYTPAQKILASVGYGTAEVVSGYADKLFMGRLIKIASKAPKPQMLEFSEGFAKGTLLREAKQLGIDGLKSNASEVLAEGITLLTQNALDINVLGKKDIGYLDNIDETVAKTLVSTTAITGGTGTVGVLGRSVAKYFDKDSKIAELELSILKLEEKASKLDNGSVERQAIDRVIKSKHIELQNVVKAVSKDLNTMSTDGYNEVRGLDKEIASIVVEAKNINKSNKLSKEEKAEILKDLELSWNSKRERRKEILNKARELRIKVEKGEITQEEAHNELNNFVGNDEQVKDNSKETNPDEGAKVGDDTLSNGENGLGDKEVSENQNKDVEEERGGDSIIGRSNGAEDVQSTVNSENGSEQNRQDAQIESKDEDFDLDEDFDFDYEEDNNTDKQGLSETYNTQSTDIQSVDENSVVKQGETIDNVINTTEPKTYSKGREKGVIRLDGQQVVFETKTHIHELGNVEELRGVNVSELGFSEYQNDIQLNDDNSIVIKGKRYVNPFAEPQKAISINSKGEYSVRLQTENGQSRTIRGDRAEEIAYQYKLKEYENETDQTIQKAIDVARVEVTARPTSISEENGNTKPKRKIRTKRSRTLKQVKQPLTRAEREERELQRLIEEEGKGTDKQGNPIDGNGKLITEKINSIQELTDADFINPSRSVELPTLSKKVDNAIGANGKPIIIKKSIFEKNAKNHKDLTPQDSRDILEKALYDTTLYGQNQKTSRPYNWIMIHLANKNSAVVLEVNENKDNVEIVNWHYLNERQFKQKERQAEREGGRILTLASAVGNTSNDLSSESKDTKYNQKITYNNKEYYPRPDGGFNVFDKNGKLRKVTNKNTIAKLEELANGENIADKETENKIEPEDKRKAESSSNLKNNKTKVSPEIKEFLNGIKDENLRNRIDPNSKILTKAYNREALLNAQKHEDFPLSIDAINFAGIFTDNLNAFTALLYLGDRLKYISSEDEFSIFKKPIVFNGKIKYFTDVNELKKVYNDFKKRGKEAVSEYIEIKNKKIDKIKELQENGIDSEYNKGRIIASLKSLNKREDVTDIDVKHIIEANEKGKEIEISIKPEPIKITPKSNEKALSRLVSNDIKRPTLMGVYHNADQKEMVATDSYAIMVIPDETITTNKILLPESAKHKTEKERIIGGEFVNYTRVMPNLNDSDYTPVNIDSLIEQVNGLAKVNQSNLENSYIRARIKESYFNPSVLLKTLIAFKESGSNNIEISITDRLVVRDADNKRKIGVIMHILSNDILFYQTLNLGDISQSQAKSNSDKDIDFQKSEDYSYLSDRELKDEIQRISDEIKNDIAGTKGLLERSKARINHPLYSVYKELTNLKTERYQEKKKKQEEYEKNNPRVVYTPKREALKISAYSGERVVYHGTKENVANKIVREGIKFGSELSDTDWRGGGYDVTNQESFSTSLNPNISKHYSGEHKVGIVKLEISPNANVVTVENEIYAEDLQDYSKELEGVDAVYLKNNGEEELVILNKDAVKIVEAKSFKVSDNVVRFHKSKSTPYKKGKISQQAFDQLIAKLKKPFAKAFKNINILTDWEAFERKAEEYRKKKNGGTDFHIGAKAETDVEYMRTPSGVIYGAKLPDGTIYINPEHLNANTPIHEFGHLWEQLMPEKFAEGVELFKNTPIGNKTFAQLRKNKGYKNHSDEKLWSEALVTYIGDKGEQLYHSSRKDKFIDWIKDFFKEIGAKLYSLSGGKIGKDFSPSDHLSKFTNRVLGDLMGGKELQGESMPIRGEVEKQYSLFNPSDFDANGNVRPEVLAEIQAEKEQIIAQAKANGTYMKAPNGKPTNLNEEQWAMVRTQRFKDWFGDWEIGAKFKPTRTAETVSEAQNKIKDIVNKPLTNKKLGITATLSNKTLQKLGSEKATKQSVSSDLHALAIANIDTIFENALIDITHSDTKNRTGINQIHRIGSAIQNPKNGEYAPIMITLKEYTDPNNGNRIYSVEAIDIETKKSAGQLESSLQSNDQSPIADFTTKIEKEIEKANNSSKVVDENGEPMVVYHGTNAEFTEFDINTPIVNGRGEGNGFYFTSDIDIAKKYAGKKGNIKKAFLNLRNNFKGFDSLNKEEREIYLKTKNDEEAYDKLNIDGFIVGGQIIVRNPSQIKSATDNVGTYSEDSNDIRYHKGDSQSVNELFNKELEQLRKGQLPAEHIFQLGTPNAILQSAGLPNLPIEMSSARLKAKAMQENHLFDLSEVEDLPRAIQNPIAVFDSTKGNETKVILTELQTKKGDNYVVAMRVSNKGRGRNSIEINDIKSIYPKNHFEGVLDWINSADNLMKHADTKKLLDYISVQSTNLIGNGNTNMAQSQSRSNANLQKKIEIAKHKINNFQNPKIKSDNDIDYQIVGEQKPYFSVLPTNREYNQITRQAREGKSKQAFLGAIQNSEWYSKLPQDEKERFADTKTTKELLVEFNKAIAQSRELRNKQLLENNQKQNIQESDKAKEEVVVNNNTSEQEGNNDTTSEDAKQKRGISSYYSRAKNTSLKPIVAKHGLLYEIKSHQKGYEKTKSFIEEVGILKAFEVAESDMVSGSNKVFLLGNILDAILDKTNKINNISDADMTSKDIEEVLKLEELNETVAKMLNEYAIEMGQGVSAFNYLYQKSSLRYDINYYKKQFKRTTGKDMPIDIEEKYKKLIAKNKELVKKLEELQEKRDKEAEKEAVNDLGRALRRVVPNNSPKRGMLKRLADNVRALKIKTNTGELNSFIIPPQIFNMALEVVATALEAGHTLELAIKKGKRYLQNELNKNNFGEVNRALVEFDNRLNGVHEEKIFLDENNSLFIDKSVLMNYVENGYDSITEIANDIKKDYFADNDNITALDIMDKLVGYSNKKNQTKSDLAKKIDDFKRIGKRILNEKELGNRMSKKDGTAELNALERDYDKAINEAKGEYNQDEKELQAIRENAKNRHISNLNVELGNVENEINKIENDKTLPKNERVNKIKEINEVRNEILDEIEILESKENTINIDKLLATKQKRLQKILNDLKKSTSVSGQVKNIVTSANVNNAETRILKQEIENIKKQIAETQEAREEILRKKQAIAKKIVRKKIQEYKERINNGDYEPAQKNTLPIDDEMLELRKELENVKHEFEVEKLKFLEENKPSLEKAKDILYGILSAVKVVKATGELSIMLIQGGRLTLNNAKNPRVVLKAFWNALQAAVNDDVYNKFMEEIRNHPDYDLMIRSGLSITETSGKITAMEEAMVGVDLVNRLVPNGMWQLNKLFLKMKGDKTQPTREDKDKFMKKVDKFNFPKGFERFASMYLNYMRVRAFLKLADKAKNAGYDTEEDLDKFEAASTAVNVMSGRANLPKAFSGPEMTKLLNVTFFSPRLTASRIQMYNPFLWARMPKFILKYYLKTMVADLLFTKGISMALTYLMADDEDKERELIDRHSIGVLNRIIGTLENALTHPLLAPINPIHDGFGKITIKLDENVKYEYENGVVEYQKERSNKKLRIELLSGDAGYVRDMSRVIFGKKVDKNGRLQNLNEVGNDKRLDILMRHLFFNKLAPVPADVKNYLGADIIEVDGVKKRMSFGEEVKYNLLNPYPIYWGNFAELEGFSEHQEKTIRTAQILSFIGATGDIY